MFPWLAYIDNDEYYKTDSSSKKQVRCVCGAHKTLNPTIHAEWCDCFHKDKFYTDSNKRKGNE